MLSRFEKRADWKLKWKRLAPGRYETTRSDGVRLSLSYQKKRRIRRWYIFSENTVDVRDPDLMPFWKGPYRTMREAKIAANQGSPFHDLNLDMFPPRIRS